MTVNKDYLASNLAYEELAKSELTTGDATLYVQKAHVLALLAIAEELSKMNEKEFNKLAVYNK